MARIITLYSTRNYSSTLETTSRLAADTWIASGEWSETPPPDDDFPTDEELHGDTGTQGHGETGTWYVSRISDDGFDLSPSPVEAGLSLGMASASRYVSIPFPTKVPGEPEEAPDDNDKSVDFS